MHSRNNFTPFTTCLVAVDGEITIGRVFTPSIQSWRQYKIGDMTVGISGAKIPMNKGIGYFWASFARSNQKMFLLRRGEISSIMPEDVEKLYVQMGGNFLYTFSRRNVL